MDAGGVRSLAICFLPPRAAQRIAAGTPFCLAVVLAAIAGLALLLGAHPERLVLLRLRCRSVTHF